MPLPEQMIEENQDQTVLVIDVSGGRDGTRMLGYLRFRFPAIFSPIALWLTPALNTFVRFGRGVVKANSPPLRS